MMHFDGCVEAIEQNSSNAKIFVLIHKMDLVPEDQREKARCIYAYVFIYIRLQSLESERRRTVAERRRIGF